MPKYNVMLMTPYLSWDEVEAASPDEAISQCNVVAEPDGPSKWVVEKLEDRTPVDYVNTTRWRETTEPGHVLIECEQCGVRSNLRCNDQLEYVEMIGEDRIGQCPNCGGSERCISGTGWED